MDCNPVGYTDPYGLSTGPGDKKHTKFEVHHGVEAPEEGDIEGTWDSDGNKLVGEYRGEHDGNKNYTYHVIEATNNESKETETQPAPEESDGGTEGVKGHEPEELTGNTTVRSHEEGGEPEHWTGGDGARGGGGLLTKTFTPWDRKESPEKWRN